MHENVNTLVGHMCPTRAGNMFPTYCKSNAKLSKSDAYTAHLTTSLLFSCLISFGRCISKYLILCTVEEGVANACI